MVSRTQTVSYPRAAARKLRRQLRSVRAKVALQRDHVVGTLLQNKIAAAWWTGCINFGDLITPLLLRRYGFTPINADSDHADLVSTGSILGTVPDHFTGYILGSGLHFYHHRCHFPNATILAVRGKLTRERIGAPKDTVLGDPGLLASRLLRRREKKRYVLGLVPHFNDRGDPRIDNIKKRYPDDVLVVNVGRQPLKVFSDIDKCEFILSSSLHGLITADSLGIPSRWMLLSDKVPGEGFKFEDYGSALGSKLAPLDLSGTESLTDLVNSTHPPPMSVTEAGEKLHGAFEHLKSHFNNL